VTTLPIARWFLSGVRPLPEPVRSRFDLSRRGLWRCYRSAVPGVECKSGCLQESQVSYDWRSDTYRLTTPARFADRLGVAGVAAARERPPLAGHLFDYQAWIVGMALDAKRFAIWADTGLGKTPMLLEWARQVAAITGGRVLILQPLQIIAQTVEMAGIFYGDGLTIDVLDSRESLIAWCTPRPAGIAI
jgi:hypothetical protein